MKQNVKTNKKFSDFVNYFLQDKFYPDVEYYE